MSVDAKEEEKFETEFEAKVNVALGDQSVEQNAINLLLQEEEEQRKQASLDAQKRRKEMVANFVKTLRRTARDLQSNFVDYGPPYEYSDPTLPMQLIAVCSHPKMKLATLHSLLNDRVDPNIPDPEDLYFTALHWCARSLHYTAIRMLCRAKANVDLTNEMGQTAISLCTIVRQPPNKRPLQIQIATYLVDQGADLNIRDKAGYTCLDYAAMNQDFELLQLYLDNGAHALRDNYTLKAKRKQILSWVTDPDCYRILHQHIQVQKEEFRRSEDKRAIARKAKDDEARLKKIHKQLATERDAKKMLEKSTQEKEQLKAIRDIRLLKFEAEETARKAIVAEQRHKFGAWKREPNGHWEWESKSNELKADLSNVYTDAKKLIIGLRDGKKYDVCNTRWRALTGNHIEATWSHSKPFEIASLDGLHLHHGGTSLDEGVELGAAAPDPLAFRDENDTELEGEDLDNILSSV